VQKLVAVNTTTDLIFNVSPSLSVSYKSAMIAADESLLLFFWLKPVVIFGLSLLFHITTDFFHEPVVILGYRCGFFLRFVAHDGSMSGATDANTDGSRFF
jgi:hypothetical protein